MGLLAAALPNELVRLFRVRDHKPERQHGTPQITVGLLAAARPDELARLSAAAAGPRQALALFRHVQRRSEALRACMYSTPRAADINPSLLSWTQHVHAPVHHSSTLDQSSAVARALRGLHPRLAPRRCVQEQRFVAYMREAEERRQAKLAAALAAASPARRQRSREDQEAFYARLLDDTSRRRVKRSAASSPCLAVMRVDLRTRLGSSTVMPRHASGLEITGACA